MIGKTVSHYIILEQIGSGGMGVVYKSEDLELKRLVALKFLPPELTRNEETRKRFIHEAQSASALDHPNICTIYEISRTDDGDLFIVMGFYEGETLKDKISRGKLDAEHANDFIHQIADGLLAAHEKGLVHRDIKPANILITKDGVAKILDFGLAKSSKYTQLTKDGSTIGTVSYMSPEQTRGAQVDQRTDIWSLGVVMYEMITGELPFKGDYEQAIIYSILNEDPEPITTKNNDLPPEINHIITKALTKDSENRYQTIGELLSDLKNFASPEYESLSFGSSKISKKFYQRWQYIALGAFVLLAVSIIYITNPFTSDSRCLESLVVLPFENFTGNDELEYFVAGMHSSLIGDIGKISALRVISKTTSNAYKNVEKSIPEIASELGVDAVIEATVLSLGDSVRLQVKLVDAFPEEQQLWVRDYYEEKSQILNLYNKVTKEISEEINIILTPQEESLLAKTRTVDTEAYDAYLKAKYYWDQLTPDALQKALEYYNLAMEKDPSWAFPYAGLAEYWVGAKQFSIVPSSFANPLIQENINKALEMDPNSPYIHYVNALIAVWTEWDWEKGEREFLKVLEINPNDAYCRAYYAHLLMILRRTDEAYEQGRLSLELDALNPLIQALYCAVLLDRGEYEKVLSITKKIPNHPVALFAMETTYYQKGDYKNSFETLIQMLQFTLEKEVIFDIQKKYEEAGYNSALVYIVNIVEEIAKTNFVMATDIAWYYREILNKPEKTLEWLEVGFKTKDPNMPYISTKVYPFDFVRDNPRYIELLKKMNLPIH